MSSARRIFGDGSGVVAPIRGARPLGSSAPPATTHGHPATSRFSRPLRRLQCARRRRSAADRAPSTRATLAVTAPTSGESRRSADAGTHRTVAVAAGRDGWAGALALDRARARAERVAVAGVRAGCWVRRRHRLRGRPAVRFLSRARRTAWCPGTAREAHPRRPDNEDPVGPLRRPRSPPSTSMPDGQVLTSPPSATARPCRTASRRHRPCV